MAIRGHSCFVAGAAGGEDKRAWLAVVRNGRLIWTRSTWYALSGGRMQAGRRRATALGMLFLLVSPDGIEPSTL
jgi:hypothetical protein